MRYIQGVTKKRNSCNFPSLQPCLGHAASFHCKFFWAHFNFDSFFSQKCFTLSIDLEKGKAPVLKYIHTPQYESFATVGEIRVWWRADFQSGSRVLKKVF